VRAIQNEEPVARRIDVDVPREVHDNRHQADDHDTHSTITEHSTMKVEPDDGQRVGPASTSLVTGPFIFLLFMPLQLARTVLGWSFSIVLSKKTLLLFFYMVGWVFLSQVSQYRNSLIQR
jgi:hypothetical protein